ncbi:MAG TPA: protein-disulfide reductase DsbD domain-containing protein [Opitutales bacterium]|nr:protein-disulfide reductase DsbD domain-containing protein [Opitutales bacterium]
MHLKRFVLGLGFLCLAIPGLKAGPVESVHTTIELVADSREIAAGENFRLGVTFEMEPEWHIYWTNPGASGLPPEFEWELPEGFEAGEVQWPAPERISLEGLVSYGYKDTVTLIVPIRVPADLEPGTEVPIGLEVSFLICKEVCLPGDASLDLALTVGNTPKPASDLEVFERAEASHPKAAFPFNIATVAQEEKTLTVEISGEGLPESLYFYAGESGMVDPNANQAYELVDGVGRLTLPLDFAFFENEMTALKGVLQSPGESWQATIPVAAKEAGASRATGAPSQAESNGTPAGLEQQLLDLGLAGWLVLAFLGGLILNVMPCVLPVLSLKVFSLLNHSGQSRGHALAHGIAYTLGVVASFVLLAAVLFGLRALGESIGWGFQLQNPGFVLVLGLVFFLFGLNLLGVYEIGSGLVGADAKVAGRKDLFGSFGVGVLAAVVGAPCVGPFVGGVGGVALQTNTVTGLLIFAMLGFGMASPFLFLAIFPKLVGYLPKPGPWMETFKQSMGFLLLAALVFLLYLLGRLAGVMAITAMLVVLLLAAIAAWIFGRWGAPGKSGKTRRIAKLATAFLLLGSAYWGLRSVDAAYDSHAGGSAVDSNWSVWSPETVDKALKADKAVFVDFTATWCLICQVNKKTALRTEATRELFEDYGVVSLVADWTRRDPEITAELEKFGRSGVPLYLLYGPDGEVTVLPQNLTNGIIREAVEAQLGENPN